MEERNTKYQISGFIFVSEADYKRALKEYNNIAGLQNKMNVDDIEGLKVVYTKLVAKNYFRTPVGINFLYELRDYIVKTQGKDDLPGIPIAKMEAGEKSVLVKESPLYVEMENKVEKYKSINMKLIIAICAMAVVIIGMFFITITNDNTGFFNAEEKVLDKYSAWQEDLNQKEKELKDWEEKLKNQEAK